MGTLSNSRTVWRLLILVVHLLYNLNTGWTLDVLPGDWLNTGCTAWRLAVHWLYCLETGCSGKKADSLAVVGRKTLPVASAFNNSSTVYAILKGDQCLDYSQLIFQDSSQAKLSLTMRWVIAMAILCWSVFGEENKVPDKNLLKPLIIRILPLFIKTGWGCGGEYAARKTDGFEGANNERSGICSLL